MEANPHLSKPVVLESLLGGKMNYYLGLGFCVVGIWAPWMLVPGVLLMGSVYLPRMKEHEDYKKELEALRSEFNQIKTSIAIGGRNRG